MPDEGDTPEDPLERYDSLLRNRMDRVQREMERVFDRQERAMNRAFSSFSSLPELRLPDLPPLPPLPPLPRLPRPARPVRAAPPAQPAPAQRVEPAVAPKPEELPGGPPKSLWEHLEDDIEVTAAADAKTTAGAPAQPSRGFWAKVLGRR